MRTYHGVHKLGTQRPIRNRPRGLDDPDFPGYAQVYDPVTALPFETLPETFVHPAGYCQNVLATGRCIVTGVEFRLGREAIRLRCDHPRTTELAGDRPDFHISLAVDRETGSSSASSSRSAIRSPAMPRSSTSPRIRRLPASIFDFVFPTGTTILY